MAGPFDDEEQEKPLDPAVERVRRKLVRFVAINLGLLFVALMAVVVAIVYRASQIEEPPAADGGTQIAVPAGGATMEGLIALPAGARIAGHALSGNRISLDVELADGKRALFLYDMAERRIVGRFAIGEEQ